MVDCIQVGSRDNPTDRASALYFGIGNHAWDERTSAVGHIQLSSSAIASGTITGPALPATRDRR